MTVDAMNFSLSLTCNVTPSSKCSLAKYAFDQAMTILTTQFLFSSPISIHAVYSLNDNNQTILAKGGPTNYLKMIDGFLYPQA